ncbi:MAG: phospho-sugar mutase, partial [Myxococcota bacterium]
NGNIARAAEGKSFLFGYEEALGYTIGDNVRDKDGVVALAAFAEMAAVARSEGKSVLDHLYAVYAEHGVVLTQQKSLKLPPGPPVGGKLRHSPPTRVGGRNVEATDDLATSVRRFADGREETIDLPKSDVLIYRLEGDARVVVRPSGTEPKLKCYYLVRRTVDGDARTAEADAKTDLETLLNTHQEELKALIG